MSQQGRKQILAGKKVTKVVRFLLWQSILVTFFKVFLQGVILASSLFLFFSSFFTSVFSYIS